MAGRFPVRSTKQARGRWPCAVCAEDCGAKTIFCEVCCKWLHFDCGNLSEAEFKQLSSIPCGYICESCCLTTKGRFDFKKSLQRLGKAGSTKGMERLRQAVISEKILLRNHPLTLEKKEMFANDLDMKIHRYSQAILESCVTDSRVAINVKGDGNCLFNSASVAISGDEMMSSELKVRTCIELVSNLEYYRNHFQYKEFSFVSDNLEEVCLDCATDGEYSSIFTMQALSSVLGREIMSVYPPRNGM